MNSQDEDTILESVAATGNLPPPPELRRRTVDVDQLDALVDHVKHLEARLLVCETRIREMR